VVSYADGRLFTETAQKFQTDCRKYNMKISVNETKSLIVSKEPIRVKLEIANQLNRE
jgi:hypothetical protein